MRKMMALEGAARATVMPQLGEGVVLVKEGGKDEGGREREARERRTQHKAP